jgi:hypothetical protein
MLNVTSINDYLTNKSLYFLSFPPFLKFKKGPQIISTSVSSLIDISEFTHYKITIYETKQKIYNTYI